MVHIRGDWHPWSQLHQAITEEEEHEAKAIVQAVNVAKHMSWRHSKWIRKQSAQKLLLETAEPELAQDEHVTGCLGWEPTADPSTSGRELCQAAVRYPAAVA